VRVEQASFQIFGGVVFVIIGLQFVFHGPSAITALRGPTGHLAGAIAMPVLIGPGTISASMIIGKRHSPASAVLSVLLGVGCAVVLVLVLKGLHDRLRARHGQLVERSIEIAGRITRCTSAPSRWR
jgi:small neutral amino acid transporter SnatA (MarC family)